MRCNLLNFSGELFDVTYWDRVIVIFAFYYN